MSFAALDRTAIYRRTLQHFFDPVAPELYQDASVTEVLINGPDDIYVERNGILQKLEGRRFASDEALLAAVHNLAEYVDRRLDEFHHSMDARLPEPERFRVHVIVPPCSRSGVVVSIRKFSLNRLTLDQLVSCQSLSPEARKFLEIAVRLHRNIVISGGTGTGKTSMLNALSAAIASEERIVVIEDSSELNLAQPHTICLEARPAQPNGAGKVTIRDLFIDSLRMRPDRIIVGEVRRGEALDLIQSMLSGHDGAMSTVHASSPALALTRLETLCLMSEIQMPVYVARTQVASAIHLIVQVVRQSRGHNAGGRFVSEIAEVRGLDSHERYLLRPLFRRTPPTSRAPNGELQPVGERCSFADEARHAGLIPDEAWSRDLFSDTPR
jgi:pilus assembly protein CpaF